MLTQLFIKIFRGRWKAMSPDGRARIIKTFLSALTETEKFRIGLPAVAGLLTNIKDNGFSPAAILDVGANVGEWSRMVSAVFPSTRILMFDGNPENEPALRATMARLGSPSECFLSLLGPEKKQAVSFYKPDAGNTGSSILPELTSFAKEVVTLPMDTLDNLTAAAGLTAPLLLKLDVQGFELEVLKGATRALSLAEIVITEVSLLPYNAGAPLFADVIAFMDQHGFVAFDLCGQSRRESDRALFQADIAFARRDSSLRAQRKFFLSEP
jgi:FkbM family methyltransferase